MGLKNDLSKLRTAVGKARAALAALPVPVPPEEVFFQLAYDGAHLKAVDKLEWEHERRVTNDEAHEEVWRVLQALGYGDDVKAVPDPEAVFERVTAALEADIVSILAARGFRRSGQFPTWAAVQAARAHSGGADPSLAATN